MPFAVSSIFIKVPISHREISHTHWKMYFSFDCICDTHKATLAAILSFSTVASVALLCISVEAWLVIVGHCPLHAQLSIPDGIQ